MCFVPKIIVSLNIDSYKPFMSLAVFESTVRDFSNQVGEYLSAFDNPLAMLGYRLAYGIAANVVINLAKLAQTLKMTQD